MTSELVAKVVGRSGVLSLDRPAALHALTREMVSAMTRHLQAWAADPGIGAIVIDHAQGRGFCAGGDIRVLHESIARDGGESARRFFYEEYQLDHLLFSYPKPVVTFMHGLTMGGGVGISLPASFRVATEATRFAMPETGIGLFPDVGGGWYLSRLRGRVGRYLALTGARIDGAECLAVGLATHYLPSTALAEAKARIAAAPEQITAHLAALAEPAPPAPLLERLDTIDQLFAADQYEQVLQALAAETSEWAVGALATLRSKSPQACKVALRQLALGGTLHDFADVMRMEYRLAARSIVRHDFSEGVRAVIVDKDNTARWDPPTPEAVTEALLDELFAPLPLAEEWQPTHAAR